MQQAFTMLIMRLSVTQVRQMRCERMQNGEDANQPGQIIEHLAMQRATDKANVAKWNLKVATFSYSFLIILILLVSLGIGFGIVVILAISGLIAIWFAGWREGNQLRQRFYVGELSNLQEKPNWETPKLLARLTSREIEILNYVAQGYSNKRIAHELNIGEQTVKNYVSGILTKLNASQRTEAAVIAIKLGLIPVK